MFRWSANGPLPSAPIDRILRPGAQAQYKLARRMPVARLAEIVWMGGHAV
ncbi:hypothetical protein C4J93_2912 [Pseudomonas sp. R2-37-08W]|nr:hypothetical protein C4J93_2912 [Pseudomonas sp. R2-37-08W]